MNIVPKITNKLPTNYNEHVEQGKETKEIKKVQRDNQEDQVEKLQESGQCPSNAPKKQVFRERILW